MLNHDGDDSESEDARNGVTGARLDRAMCAHLSALYELRPVPDEFLQLVREFDRRRVRDKR